MSNTILAFDKSTVREYDADGRLHVTKTNISKAAVNPYYGREIPAWEELGLSADKVYMLLRDPAELERAAPTFNNIPVLFQHVPVDADEHHPKLVVGSTGTDAAFVDGYLQNSAVFWARHAIDGIENETQKELSSAYRYTADMTAGVFDGVAYDGIMRDIIGNHVALVDEGRAGPDVVVADRKPEMLKSRRALMVHGALSALIKPKLAQDSKLDITSALVDVTDGNLSARSQSIAAAVVKMAKPKLAQDEGLDVDDVCKVIAAVQGEEMDVALDEIEVEIKDEDKDEFAADSDSPREDVIADLMDYLKDHLPDDVYEHAAGLVRREATMDEELKPDGPADGPAMDRATVSAMIAAAEKRGAKAQALIEQAREDVKPLVGRLIGMDSAEAIYATALEAKGYKKADLSGASVATLKAMCAREAGLVASPRVAMDHKAQVDKRADFNARYGVK